jgi:hypothetical protein
MSIAYIYPDYFQKSRVFLYPMLGFGFKSVPVEFKTYMMIEDPTGQDRSLLAIDFFKDKIEEGRSNASFEEFFIKKVMTNERFLNSELINEHTVRAVFDLSDIKEDVKHVKNGNYSKIAELMKRKLTFYYPLNHANRPFIESYLYPNWYIKIYANLLDVSEKLLQEVGELCDKPNFEKEHVVLSENISLKHVFEKEAKL